MTTEDKLLVLYTQERLLSFATFPPDDGWRLGNILRRLILELVAAEPAHAGVGGTAEIELTGQILFTCATAGAKPNQADWIRRKRNTVHRFERSSYAIGLTYGHDGAALLQQFNLPGADYAAHGGGFPLRVGEACVGSVILSGFHQRDDHEIVVASLAEMLGVSVPATPPHE